MTVPLTLFVAIAQTSLIPQVRLFGVSPNLFLLFAVSWVLTQGLRRGIVFGLLGGVVIDGASGGPFGLVTLCLVVVSVLAGLGELNVFKTAWFLPYAVAASASIVYQVLLLFFLQMGGRPVSWGPTLWLAILPSTLLNALLMPLVYRATRFVGRLTLPEPAAWE